MILSCPFQFLPESPYQVVCAPLYQAKNRIWSTANIFIHVVSSDIHSPVGGMKMLAVFAEHRCIQIRTCHGPCAVLSLFMIRLSCPWVEGMVAELQVRKL